VIPCRTPRRRIPSIRSAGARLPRLKEHFGIKGGNKSAAVWEFHSGHVSVPVRTRTESVSVVGSSSSSSLDTSLVSGMGVRSGEGALCDRCHRPTSLHDPTCSEAANLKVVNQ